MRNAPPSPIRYDRSQDTNPNDSLNLDSFIGRGGVGTEDQQQMISILEETGHSVQSFGLPTPSNTQEVSTTKFDPHRRINLSEKKQQDNTLPEASKSLKDLRNRILSEKEPENYSASRHHTFGSSYI